MRGKGRRRFPYVIAGICAILVSLELVFQLSYVSVRGSVHNSAEAVSDIVCKDYMLNNTLLIRLFNVNRKIRGEGFISSVNVTITKVHAIRIDVTEKKLAGCVQYDGTCWYFDSSGIVQAEAEKCTDGDGIPLAEGLALTTAPVWGEKLPVDSAAPIQSLSILRESIAAGLKQPDRAVFSDDGTMSLVYGDVTVLLGKGTSLALRLEKLAKIIDILTDGTYRGTLHLENYDGSQAGIIFDRDA